MMSYGYSWLTIVFLAGRALQFIVRDYLGVCVFGIHKIFRLGNIRTLGEYV